MTSNSLYTLSVQLTDNPYYFNNTDLTTVDKNFFINGSIDLTTETEYLKISNNLLKDKILNSTQFAVKTKFPAEHIQKIYNGRTMINVTVFKEGEIVQKYNFIPTEVIDEDLDTETNRITALVAGVGLITWRMMIENSLLSDYLSLANKNSGDFGYSSFSIFDQFIQDKIKNNYGNSVQFQYLSDITNAKNTTAQGAYPNVMSYSEDEPLSNLAYLNYFFYNYKPILGYSMIAIDESMLSRKSPKIIIDELSSVNTDDLTRIKDISKFTNLTPVQAAQDFSSFIPFKYLHSNVLVTQTGINIINNEPFTYPMYENEKLVYKTINKSFMTRYVSADYDKSASEIERSMYQKIYSMNLTNLIFYKKPYIFGGEEFNIGDILKINSKTGTDYHYIYRIEINIIQQKTYSDVNTLDISTNKFNADVFFKTINIAINH